MCQDIVFNLPPPPAPRMRGGRLITTEENFESHRLIYCHDKRTHNAAPYWFRLSLIGNIRKSNKQHRPPLLWLEHNFSHSLSLSLSCILTCILFCSLEFSWHSTTCPLHSNISLYQFKLAIAGNINCNHIFNTGIDEIYNFSTLFYWVSLFKLYTKLDAQLKEITINWMFYSKLTWKAFVRAFVHLKLMCKLIKTLKIHRFIPNEATEVL